MTPSGTEAIKRVLGGIPFTAELYWLMRQRGKPINTRFSLRGLQENIPQIAPAVAELRKGRPAGKKVLFSPPCTTGSSMLHWWACRWRRGAQSDHGLPALADWQKEINMFDLRRQNAYARKVLDRRPQWIVSFLSARAPYVPLPPDLVEAVKEVTLYDTQYTLQVEEVDTECEIYKLRFNRNRDIAQAALAWLRQSRPDVVVVPNGTIQELGVFYRVARHLKIPTVTYEFSDQRQRIWVAQNNEVMRQDTNGCGRLTTRVN